MIGTGPALAVAGFGLLAGVGITAVGPGGVLVIPVAGRMLRVRDTVDGPVVEEHGWYRFVPLVLQPLPGPGAGS